MRGFSGAGYLIVATLLCAAIVLAGWELARHQRAVWRVRLTMRLNLSLSRTLRDLYGEFENSLSVSRTVAAAPRTASEVERLLVRPRTRAALSASPAQANLRAALQRACHHGSAASSGFFIIDFDNRILVSQYDSDLGQGSPLAGSSEFLARIRRGTESIGLPRGTRPAAERAGAEGGARVYAGAPIENAAGAVIAALACLAEHGQSLAKIMVRHVGTREMEIYALDASGRLLGGSPLAAELRKLGLARSDRRGDLYFAARDPGVDLTAAHPRPVSRRQSPLTRMAASATAGGSGVDVRGYRDPRGVPVVGAWAWDDQIGFAVAAEWSVADAYWSLRQEILTIIVFGLLAITGVFILTTLYIYGRRRIITSEQRFHDLAIAGSDWLWETGADLRYTYLDERFRDATGISSERWIGRTPKELYARGDFRADPDVWARIWRLWSEHRPFTNFRASIESGEGHMVHLCTGGRPFQDARGRFAGFRGVTRNITREVEMLAALSDQQERSEFLLAHIDEGVLLHDGEAVVDVNSVGAAMFGYQRDELIGLPVIELVAPRGRAEARSAIVEGRHDSYELPALRKDRGVFPIECVSSQVSFQGRRLRLTLTRDISAHKAAAKQRKADIAEDNFLGEMAVLASECEQVESFVREALERWCGFLGWPTAHAWLRPTWASAKDEYRDLWFPVPPGAVRGEGGNPGGGGRREAVPGPLVAWIRTRGEPLWISDLAAESGPAGLNVEGIPRCGAAFGFPIHSHGEVLGVIELFSSEVLLTQPPILAKQGQLATQIGRVWEREAAGLRLESSARRFEAIALASSDWVWEMDSLLRYTFLSSGFENALGVAPEQWLGNSCDSLVPAQCRADPDFREFLEGLREHRAFKNVRHFAVDVNGRLRCLISHGAPMTDPAGRFCGFQGASSDITSLYEAEADRERAKAESERANQAKSEFLASLSHDFRTPLNAILGFGQLLDTDVEEPLSSRQAESVSQIIEAGGHLNNLLGEVLELSRIESGKVDLIIEQIPVHKMINGCVALIKPSAVARRVRVDAILPDQDFGMIEADGGRLHSVLMNLLSNAIKYSPRDGVVTVQLDPVADKRLRLSVTDSGIGIPESHWPRVFEPFDRLGAQRSNVAGTGIGLSISKKLVELMDGRIGFDSEYGYGSTFWIELPATATLRRGGAPSRNDAGAWNAPLNSVGDPRTRYVALYIEDNAANRALMEGIVGSVENLSLRTAKDAESGLQMIASAPPDVILMDINLPGMDGIQAVRRLRVREEFPRIPVLAVSAVAIREAIDAALEAGFDAYLTKPLDVTKILRIISRLLGQNAMRSGGALEKSPAN